MSTTVPATEPAPRIFLDAEIRPYRSLSGPGFLLVMGALAGASFVTGMFYVLHGAWPVMGFFGLDVLLVYVAFRLSYRQAKLVERVRVTTEHLDVERKQPSGRRERFRFQSYWTRVLIDEPVEHGSQLRLVSHGRELIVGAFLAPEERGKLAKRIRAALAAAKGTG